MAGLAVVALTLAGCSSNDSSSASTSSATAPASAVLTQSDSTASSPSSSAAAAPGGALDTSTCLDIGFAKDNLMIANNSSSARGPADTLEKYSPPDSVKAAIEHFVTTGGAQPNDADLDTNRNLITDWLKQVCPNVK